MPIPLEDEFGDIVRKARAGRGCTIEQLSATTGISAARLASFESYRDKPSRAEVESIASTLRLEPVKLWEIAADLWCPKPDPWRVEKGVLVLVTPVDVGGYSENSYILGCAATRKAVVVDPGGSVDAIAAKVRNSGLLPEAIAVTHGHSDHTAGIASLADKLGVSDVYAHPDDLRSLANLRVHGAVGGDQFAIGDLRVAVLHTPGHTPGSVCYLAGRVCCVGDTLFAGSVGNAHGAAGYESLLTSVRNRLLSLPGETALLPGHGPSTTVQEEILHNPFFCGQPD